MVLGSLRFFGVLGGGWPAADPGAAGCARGRVRGCAAPRRTDSRVERAGPVLAAVVLPLGGLHRPGRGADAVVCCACAADGGAERSAALGRGRCGSGDGGPAGRRCVGCCGRTCHAGAAQRGHAAVADPGSEHDEQGGAGGLRRGGGCGAVRSACRRRSHRTDGDDGPASRRSGTSSRSLPQDGRPLVSAAVRAAVRSAGRAAPAATRPESVLPANWGAVSCASRGASFERSLPAGPSTAIGAWPTARPGRVDRTGPQPAARCRAAQYETCLGAAEEAAWPRPRRPVSVSGRRRPAPASAHQVPAPVPHGPGASGYLYTRSATAVQAATSSSARSARSSVGTSGVNRAVPIPNPLAPAATHSPS